MLVEYRWKVVERSVVVEGVACHLRPTQGVLRVWNCGIVFSDQLVRESNCGRKMI